MLRKRTKGSRSRGSPGGNNGLGDAKATIPVDDGALYSATTLCTIITGEMT